MKQHLARRTGSRQVLAFAVLVTTILLASLPGLARAQEVRIAHLQAQAPRAEHNITTLGDDLMGDRVNLYNGSLEFIQTDVSLPGNDSLPVAFSRRHVAGRDTTIRGALADWDIEAPFIGGSFTADKGWVTSAGSSARCGQFSAPPTRVLTGTSYWSPEEFWQGHQLGIPGLASQEVLIRSSANSSAPQDGLSWPLVTRNHWQIRCISSLLNGAGEGFVAKSPEGVEYRFDWIAARSLPVLRDGAGAMLGRAEVRLMATRVTDRFGNWVSYTYDPTSPWLLRRISASDGRTLTLSYGSVLGANRVVGVSDGSRTWSYAYSGQGDLERVTRPDGSNWQFNLRGLVFPYANQLGEGSTCDFPGGWPADTLSGSMTHPSGATGVFQVNYRSHPRTAVPRYCIQKVACVIAGGQTDSATNRTAQAPRAGVKMASSTQSSCTSVAEYPRWPKETVSQTLTSKTLSGPGMSSLTWRYNYPSSGGTWSPCSACPGTSIVEVTDPRNIVTRHTFGNVFGVNDGQLLQVQEAWNGATALRSSIFRYAASGPWPEPAGLSVAEHTDFFAARNRPQDLRIIQQDGAAFTWQANSFDFRARPLSVTRSSSLGFSRTETTAYFDHGPKWVLGQLASVTDGGGAVMESHSYDSMTARRLSSTSFGRLTARYSWNANGLLQTHQDAAGHSTSLGNYMRGIAQLVVFPDGTSQSASVNNLGLVNSITNQVGITTSYTYDAMGRLASVNYPAEGGLSYHSTNQVFEPVATTEYGIAAGHWRQTISTGNARTVRYYDALWRERLAVNWDAASPANTSSFVETRYDPNGQKSFASYAQRSLGSVDAATPGTAWARDAIGRVFAQYQDSELGLLLTQTQYLSGFRRRVVNPRGFATTYSYQAFDDPSDESVAIASVALPEGVSLTLSRDRWGKPLAISRSGSYGGQSLSATRLYVYDANQRLCKSIEPETGTSVQSYDLANNVAWRASGLSLPGGGCDQASVAEASKVNYSYDTLNRLTAVSYGDGSSGITRGYTADGLLAVISSGSSTWSYGYNNRRLLTGETLNLGGSVYVFGWAIDAHGHVAGLNYPGGPSVAYSPDALGRPTQVSGFAGGIWHHPNGQIGGYTLANGVKHSTSQNQRGLPLLWRDAGVVQDLYSYDANANVTAIADQQEGVTHRSLAYDGLDRLTSASGVWGAGNYGYDPLDNLRTSSVGGRSMVAGVDAANRLSNVVLNGVAMDYVYGAAGNLQRRGSQSFSFDIGNRLQSAVGLASYAYDGHGRRTWIAYANGKTRQQVYNQAGKLLLTVDSALGATRHIYLGDRLIAETDTLGGRSFVHTDALGSPVARTSLGAQLLSRTRFEPFGNVAAGTVPGGIGFTGHVSDADSGLVYMQQRYYDPLAGRFLSVDPVVINAKTGRSFNRYFYGNGNPYRYKDPDGRLAQELIVVGGGVLLLSAACDTCRQAIGNGIAAVASAIGRMFNQSDSGNGSQQVTGQGAAEVKSPEIKPSDVAGKTAGEIGQIAVDAGLKPKGPDPVSGKGAFVDPKTGEQRVLVHGDHAHVNDAAGNRLDINGNRVPANSPAAHLPVRTDPPKRTD